MVYSIFRLAIVMLNPSIAGHAFDSRTIIAQIAEKCHTVYSMAGMVHVTYCLRLGAVDVVMTIYGPH